MTPSSVKMAMSIPFAALLFGSPKQVAHALAMSKIEKNAKIEIVHFIGGG